MTLEITDIIKPSIEVCYGPQCSDVGGRRLTVALDEAGLESLNGDCRNQCPNAPLVLVNNRMIVNATAEKVCARVDAIKNGLED